eukprot:CAMPEP_0180366954 /NCGR_PEP_ID=MMETSP0989-20121125/16468_1 /TAXON_ID=697907 /ORGANISM="non described non described, Strain CCMP2293" /LENGTH=259 /DNA_ID=CAMNT_0022360759 /DNA_START=23 /DNA_END=802 /DNA_ORIENTATION=-
MATVQDGSAGILRLFSDWMRKNPSTADLAVAVTLSMATVQDGSAGILRLFSDWMRKNPSTADLAVAVTLSMLGDLCAQASTKSGKNGSSWRAWNVHSLARIALWSLVCTPIVSMWLELLETTFGSGEDATTVLKKLAVDQGAFGPLLMLLFFLYVAVFDALASQASLQEGIATLRREVWPAYKGSVVFWVPVSVSLFTVVPPHLKILVINLAGLGWNCLLALRMQGAANHAGEEGGKDGKRRRSTRSATVAAREKSKAL